MATMGDRIKQLRTANEMTQEELADKLGLQKSAIAKYENGRVENVKRSTIQKMAELFGKSPSYIMGFSDSPLPSNVSVPAARAIPILGTIGCGEGPIGEESFRGYFFMDHTIKADYALFTKGDSMIDAGIQDGDIALLKMDCDIEDGKIYGVIFGAAEEAVLKKLYRQDGKVILQSCNPNYPPIIIDDGDMRVIGKLTWVCHKAQ